MSVLDLFVALSFVVGVVSSIIVAFHPNILYAAVGLIFTLLSVAGMYGALGADFLAGIQLIIYVGGIIIVILFAVMMSEHIYKKRLADGFRRYWFPALLCAALLYGLKTLIGELNTENWLTVANRVPTTKWIGEALVGPYALIFQYVVIVLLLGLIGAVVIARPDFSNAHKNEGDQT